MRRFGYTPRSVFVEEIPHLWRALDLADHARTKWFRRFKDDATIRMAGGELVATAEADDMYAAIDALSDKLDRQLDKHKGKVQGRQHVSPER